MIAKEDFDHEVKITELEIGDMAPDFLGVCNGNRKVALSDFKGKYLILYFYPKDSTSGCTKEAIAFTALQEKFAALDATIIGVSKDSIKSHETFIAKYDLNFNLVADKEMEICRNYYCWVEKSMYGRKYMGTQRATFIIDRNSKIAKIWRNVKVDGHAEEVLEALKSL